MLRKVFSQIYFVNRGRYLRVCEMLGTLEMKIFRTVCVRYSRKHWYGVVDANQPGVSLIKNQQKNVERHSFDFFFCSIRVAGNYVTLILRFEGLIFCEIFCGSNEIGALKKGITLKILAILRKTNTKEEKR